MSTNTRTAAGGLDAALLAVIANRLDSVCREMTNTLLRSGRSAVLNMARDFSCSLVTGDNQMLASAEGLPVHVFGSQFLSEAMCNLHPDLVEGDAFLHNDVYLGNTHSADHTILVPVFVEGEHLFTCCAKAHQADCGNSLPTTYAPFAGDVYEEGALNFPCVQVQRNYKDIDDIIRMCRRRIRVPDQWYGDYLAMLGAARIGERRLKELAAKFGKPLIRDFIREWFDYSERRMIHALKQLPTAEFTGTGAHDPFPALPEGVPLKVKVKIDAERGPSRNRSARQYRLCSVRAQRVEDVRDQQHGHRTLQFDRSRRAAQRGQLPPHHGASARELRRRNPALSDLMLGCDH